MGCIGVSFQGYAALTENISAKTPEGFLSLFPLLIFYALNLLTERFGGE